MKLSTQTARFFPMKRSKKGIERSAMDDADMVLPDDSFTTIAYAIKEDRRVYRNIRKIIQFLLWRRALIRPAKIL